MAHDQTTDIRCGPRLLRSRTGVTWCEFLTRYPQSFTHREGLKQHAHTRYAIGSRKNIVLRPNMTMALTFGEVSGAKEISANQKPRHFLFVALQRGQSTPQLW